MALLEYFNAEKILKKYSIKSIESSYVSSAEKAVEFSAGKSIVLKAVSANALHKNKSGLVVAGLLDAREIANAYKTLQKRAEKYRPYRIIAQKMVKGGIEIIIGGNEDPQFGKMILLGLGGIYVESFKDFALRVCPVDIKEATLMVRQLRSKNIIAPNPQSEKMVAELVVKASKMYSNIDVKELDLNPIILHDGTYDAVDIRMIK